MPYIPSQFYHIDICHIKSPINHIRWFLSISESNCLYVYRGDRLCLCICAVIVETYDMNNDELPKCQKEESSVVFFKRAWIKYAKIQSVARNMKELAGWYCDIITWQRIFDMQMTATVYPCQKSWLTLVKVMACCLTTPTHYQNHCWLCNQRDVQDFNPMVCR